MIHPDKFSKPKMIFFILENQKICNFKLTGYSLKKSATALKNHENYFYFKKGSTHADLNFLLQVRELSEQLGTKTRN